MVVRDRVGRRRYIIAQNTPKLKEIAVQLKSIDKKSKIVLIVDNFAVIFSRHWYKERIIEILQSNGIKTYRTTGTIKKAKKIISNLHGGGG